jgi:hypothetical protein
MNSEKLNINDSFNANTIKSPTLPIDHLDLKGKYHFQCFDCHGNLKWEDTIDNLVVNVGKNLTLDTIMAGAAYTVTGPFMGLVSSVGYSAIVAGDTMASHAGWTEAGLANAPTYTAPRKTVVFNAASAGSKTTTAALSFAITGAGTVKGAFIVLGTGAVSTIDNTAGVLFSSGLFTGGDRPVVNTDTLNVAYTVSA